MRKLKIGKGVVRFEVYPDLKIVDLYNIILDKYDVPVFGQLLSEFIQMYPKYSIMFMQFHKDEPEYEVIMKVLSKLKFKRLGKKLVYSKKLVRRKHRYRLTFKTLKQVRRLTPFRDIHYESFKKTKAISDVFDAADPDKAFREYVINKRRKGWNFLAYEGEKPVGMFCLRKREYMGKYGTLTPVAIHPKHRGKGYALECLYKAEEEFLKAGVKEYRGSTDSNNVAMIKTFKKFGCKKLRDIPIYVYRPGIAFRRFMK